MAKYYYTLDASTFHSYSERPTTSSGWTSAVSSYGTSRTIYRIDSDGSNGAESGKACYLIYGSNEKNTSFDIFYCATLNSSYAMGPFLFEQKSQTSMAATYGSSKTGIWKLGTISAGSTTAITLADFYIIALRNDADNGYTPTEKVTISDTIYNAMVNDIGTVQGGQFQGFVNATVSLKPGETATMGQTTVTASVSSTSTPSGYSVSLQVLGVKLTSANGTFEYSGTIPYTCEKYFLDAETRKTTTMDFVITYPEADNNRPVSINGDWQPYADSYYYSSDSFVLAIDSTRVPSFTAIAGTKESNHNSTYVMLVNGYDKITFTGTVSDQSYPYNGVYSNYSPTFALYIGDSLLGNYSPSSITQSAETLTCSYSGSWGPMTVNPAVSLGVNQTFTAKYQDRFGRQASAAIPLTIGSTTINYVRFYNYINPSWTFTATRCTSDGTPDDKEGTYAQLVVSWDLSLLDYSLSPHTGTTRPTLKITDNQTSASNSYTITTASSSYTKLLSSIDVNLSYTYTCVLTDAAGRTYTLTAFVPSGSVFMDFKAGGDGLGIGMRAEKSDTLQIAWDTEINNGLSVAGNTTITGDLTVNGTISGDSGSSFDPSALQATASTYVRTVAPSVTYSLNGWTWRGIAIPLNYQSNSGGDAFIIATATNSTTSAGSNSITFPWTFIYVPMVSFSSGSSDTARQILSVTTTGCTLYNGSNGGNNTCVMTVAGMVDNYFTSLPTESYTTVSISSS